MKSVIIIFFKIIVLYLILPYNILSQKEFIPDTTINSKLILRNIGSAKMFYANIDSSIIIDDENNFFKIKQPFILFLNDSKTQYLAAIIHEGTWRNYFSEFEIGEITDTTLSGINFPYIITKYKDFKTESGISLGITLDSLKQIKGKNYSVIDNKIKYCYNSLNSEFLENDDCEYYLECELENNRIIRIRFGYSPV
jgi:hypothetical protein